MAESKMMYGHEIHGNLPVSTKIPPYWEPRMAKSFPFRQWMRRVRLWARTTELEQYQVANAVVLRLGGTAQELGYELAQQPSPIGNGQQTILEAGNRMIIPDFNAVEAAYSGLEVLLHHLRKHFDPLDQERALKPLAEFFTFERLSQETCDEVISRFELIRFRAGNEAGLVISFVGYAWILLHVVGIPVDK